jgi:thiol-disulfide isomerase/thioredoxin
MKYFYLIVSVGLAAIIVLAGCSEKTPETTHPIYRMEVAEFDRIISDEAFSGLVVAFATWCPPCREELPEIARLYRNGLPQGTQIVAISLDEGDSQTVQRLVDKLELPFPVYHVGMEAAAHYKIVGVPTVMLVQNGRILENTPGPQSPSQLTSKLKKVKRPAS